VIVAEERERKSEREEERMLRFHKTTRITSQYEKEGEREER